MVHGVEILAAIPVGGEGILTDDALAFLADLQRRFNPEREARLAAREARRAEIVSGPGLGFLPETAHVRDGEWTVAPAHPRLNNRRVEITGPAEYKMMINALNSGAKVFMADLEDALSPTWTNSVVGQAALRDAVRKTITFSSPEGKQYRLNDEIATLVVRPRGWHLHESHLLVDGKPISASLFDFGLYAFHNMKQQIEKGDCPAYYLPKMESHLEARLWNEVFTHTEQAVGVPHGSIRATVLIETYPAAFEMEEILYELREHAAGLNAGRWDYIFSLIKTMREDAGFILPDRVQVTMAVPFMRAYTELMVRTCHKRGAHAIGGMAAFIPTRKDPALNELAFAKVREDKEREAKAGFDGSWVAHPGLVPEAMKAFDAAMGDRENQKLMLREDVATTADQLKDTAIPGSTVTDAGVRTNVSVAIQYLDNWLRGIGAAAINNLMEDAATAEISRAQLWQWIRHGVVDADGTPITIERYRQTREEELAALGGGSVGRQGEAAAILDRLVEATDFIPFLTLPAYELLD